MRINRTMQSRQIAGRMFSEDAVLVAIRTTRDKRGRAVKTETRSDIKVATNPLSMKVAQESILTEGGSRVGDLRIFYTIVDVDPESRDIIEYEGDKYTIITTARYGSHSESIGSRKEVQ